MTAPTSTPSRLAPQVATPAYSEQQIADAGRAACDVILRMVENACGRKISGSAFPMVGGKSVSWADWMARTFVRAAQHVADQDPALALAQGTASASPTPMDDTP